MSQPNEPIRAHIHTEMPTPSWTITLSPTVVSVNGEVTQVIGEPMVIRQSP